MVTLLWPKDVQPTGAKRYWYGNSTATYLACPHCGKLYVISIHHHVNINGVVTPEFYCRVCFFKGYVLLVGWPTGEVGTA